MISNKINDFSEEFIMQYNEDIIKTLTQSEMTFRQYLKNIEFREIIREHVDYDLIEYAQLLGVTDANSLVLDKVVKTIEKEVYKLSISCIKQKIYELVDREIEVVTEILLSCNESINNHKNGITFLELKQLQRAIRSKKKHINKRESLIRILEELSD